MDFPIEPVVRLGPVGTGDGGGQPVAFTLFLGGDELPALETVPATEPWECAQVTVGKS